MESKRQPRLLRSQNATASFEKRQRRQQEQQQHVEFRAVIAHAIAAIEEVESKVLGVPAGKSAESLRLLSRIGRCIQAGQDSDLWSALKDKLRTEAPSDFEIVRNNHLEARSNRVAIVESFESMETVFPDVFAAELKTYADDVYEWLYCCL